MLFPVIAAGAEVLLETLKHVCGPARPKLVIPLTQMLPVLNPAPKETVIVGVPWPDVIVAPETAHW